MLAGLFFCTIAIGVATIIVGLWGLICNRRTYTQRKAMLDQIFATEDSLHLLRLYDQVPYDNHMWALFWFHNPEQLYPKELRCLPWLQHTQS